MAEKSSDVNTLEKSKVGWLFSMMLMLLTGKLIPFEVCATLMKGGVKDGLAREVRKGRVLGVGQRVHQGGGRQDILRLHRLCGQVRSERH